jgi:hypothetical protein
MTTDPNIPAAPQPGSIQAIWDHLGGVEHVAAAYPARAQFLGLGVAVEQSERARRHLVRHVPVVPGSLSYSLSSHTPGSTSRR